MTDPERAGGDAHPPDTGPQTAAERLLRSLGHHGVAYLFGNFGTDHTPLLEAAARLREAGDHGAMPELVVCPHEFVAMSATHGYAAATGDPQAVLVHVDVGTQNLGAAMHNAHRANAPVLVIAGLAPVTHADHPGSRDHVVHYFQDVFDQPGIVREYCRWTAEYRPPTDPDELVARALDRATGPDPGPVYLSATREALETRGEWADDPSPDPPTAVRPSVPSASDLDRLAAQLRDATAPLVVTSRLGVAPDASDAVAAVVQFAESAGAGVVEHAPTTLSFPRDHALHVGFDPAVAFEHADYVVLAGVDVPWLPADESPDARVIQLEWDPTKRAYPQWPFAPDERYAADPAGTLGALADRLDPVDGEAGRERWAGVSAERRAAADEAVAEARAAGRLTPGVLSAAVAGVVDDRTSVVEDGVTSKGAILEQFRQSRPGSYHSKGGAGLGWTGGAAVGVALARPDERVIALVGDGGYLFSHPTATAWMGAAADAPTLTVVYDNQGWNAVAASTRAAHPDGAAASTGVRESRFDPAIDLTAPATAVDAMTRRVTAIEELDDAIADGVAAVGDGRPAVVVVEVERPGE